MYPIKLIVLYALSTICLGFSMHIEARAYVVERFETYTVRCSSIQTSELPNSVIDRYDVREPSADMGIVSCVIQKEDDDKALSNVEGSFTGYLQNLIGHRTTLNFRPVLENNAATYIATYERTSTSPVRFWMNVAAGASTHEFEFQDPSE